MTVVAEFETEFETSHVMIRVPAILEVADALKFHNRGNLCKLSHRLCSLSMLLCPLYFIASIQLFQPSCLLLMLLLLH